MGLVIASGAFDGHEDIVEIVLADGLPDLCDGGIEGGAVVLDNGWWDEDTAVEVSEHPLGSGLAQSTQTMPKCSGPTFWTRGWKAPRGLWTASGRWLRGRLRVREVDIETASGKKG